MIPEPRKKKLNEKFVTRIRQGDSRRCPVSHQSSLERKSKLPEDRRLRKPSLDEPPRNKLGLC